MTEAAGEQPAEGSEVLAILKRVQEVQEHRARCYVAFRDGFKSLISTKAEGPYRHLMQQLTAQFSDCSSAVREMAAALGEVHGRPDLVTVLRSLQEGEKEKLRLTLSLQALRQAEASKQFSWQAEDADVLEPPAPLGGHPRGCGCCAGKAAAEAPPPEPSQAEFEAAVAEATKALDNAIRQVNDAVEEIKYAVEELQEGSLVRVIRYPAPAPPRP